MTHAAAPIVRALFVVAMCLLAPIARAQSAAEVLDAARQAIAEIDGFEAQFKLSGEGGSMLNPTIPSMNGKLFFGTHDELGRVIRVIGEGKDKQADPGKPIDMLIAADRYTWVDHKEQTINIAPVDARRLPSALTLVLIDSIIQPDPFAKDTELAKSVTLGAQEEVNGELCDQLVIMRAKDDANPRSGTVKYDQAIWWISTRDKLPRKVAHITDAGFVKVTLTFEMSNLRTSTPTAQQLDVRRPAGFKVNNTMPGANADTPAQDRPERDATAGTTTAPDSTSERPAPPRDPSAPGFSFTTVDGRTIDNSTQRGRVSVLYFCGSWCLPCNETTPLIDALAGELDDDTLDVFALSVREADPSRVERTFASEYPNTTLAVNPPSIASDLRVRVFPTIVVIDRSGSIVYQRGIEKGLSPEDLVNDARQRIEQLLTNG